MMMSQKLVVIVTPMQGRGQKRKYIMIILGRHTCVKTIDSFVVNSVVIKYLVKLIFGAGYF